MAPKQAPSSTPVVDKVVIEISSSSSSSLSDKVCSSSSCGNPSCPRSACPVCSFSGAASKKWSKGKAVVIDEAGLVNMAKKVGGTSSADIFESGLVAPPRNPYFIAKKPKSKSRNDLCIPVDVVKDHGLKFRLETNIHDEEGRKWPTPVAIWKDGRVVLKRGWKAFCKNNHVKEGDNCLCEFVLDSRQKVRFLKVRIFRA